MSDRNWERLKEVFHAAVALPVEERARYLNDNAGDPSFRAAVESLLESHDQKDSFVDQPAFQAAAEMLVDGLELQPNQIVGHYRIVSLLGEGGMGRVYLAEDTKLHRKVSLKFVSANSIRDQNWLRRFEQEARAASALNHPNILTIHEIVEADGLLSIVAEYIDGLTLRERLEHGPIAVGEALHIAEQIAFALAAAHAEGIVHRDIKPENIMVRRDGIIKILDFGVAKMSEASDVGTAKSGGDTEVPIRSVTTTEPGLIMGTAAYMSPEQVRGLSVDARTDIWSLGSILYEMLAGHNAFEGGSKADVVAAILHREPPRLSLGAHTIAPGLEQIINQALQKDRARRYQTANELLDDIRDIKQRLQFDMELRRTEPNAIGTTAETGFLVSPVPAAASRLRRGPGSVIVWLSAGLTLAILIALIGFAPGLSSFVRRNRGRVSAINPFEKITFTSLTNSGRIKDAVISRDGNYVVYVEESGGREGIFLRQVASPNAVQVVAPNDAESYGPTFSNNGDFVYYVVKERNNSIGVLNKVPVLGGPATKVITDVDGPVSFSPDGRELTFIRGSSTGERALMLAHIDGTEERVLARRGGAEPFSYGGPAWSPDGKRIACGAGINDAGGRSATVVTVDLSNGAITTATSYRWGSIGRISWLPDGAGMIFTATELAAKSSSQLWYLSYPAGEAHRISNDLDDYNGVSLTSDATALVTMQTQTLSSIWVAPDGSTARARQISSSKYDGYNGLYTRFVWGPDNHIFYTAMVGDSPAIFSMNPDGSGTKQLTADPGRKTLPSVSRDGRYIVYVSDRDGLPQVWRMNSDGSNEQRLTDGVDDSWPQFTPDGKWVIFQRSIEGKRTIWKVAVDGGQPLQLTDHPSVCPVLSPDGQWISCYYRTETKAPWKLSIIPISGGEPVRLFDIPPTVTLLSLVRWTPDGSALAYIDNRGGVSNVWTQPLDGSKPTQLTDLKTDRIFWFDWSPDGKQLALTRGTVTSDAVRIQADAVR